MSSDVFAGMPSAPGNLPKRLSNEWFSIMISMTCLMGDRGEAARPAITADAGLPDASKGSKTAKDTPPAARTLECFTRQLCARWPASSVSRRFPAFPAASPPVGGPSEPGELADRRARYGYCMHG